jgi:hypothetical protein
MEETTDNQLKNLYANANKDVQAYLMTDELDGAVAVFGKVYKLPVSSYLALKNTITLILLGAILPENAVDALEKNCGMPGGDAYSLAKDLDETVFQKVRLSVLGKSTADVKTIKLEDDTASKEELRKEIMDTTKRPSEASTTPEEPGKEGYVTIQKAILQPGSRSQLLEQLQVLDEIPNDDEVSERLSKIKEQIATLDSKKDNTHDLDSNIALEEFMFGEKGKEVADVKQGPATYSKAPTSYNVDPYREVVTE